LSDTARPKTAGDKLSADEINGDLPSQMTAGDTINGATYPVAVYIKDSDGECYKTAAGYSDERTSNFVGFAITNGTDGNSFTVQNKGVVSGFTGLDAGKMYYLSNSAGTISTTAGTYRFLVGVALSATQLFILSHRPALGAWVSINSTTVYQAETDGLVVFSIWSTPSGSSLTGYSDSNAAPTTIRAANHTNAAGGGPSITFPVKKGDYYKVLTNGSYSDAAHFWIPFY